MGDETTYILRPGTQVRIGPPGEHSINAVVLAVSFGSMDITNYEYRVAWWSGNERKDSWIHESEINWDLTKPEDDVPIGFRATSK